MMFISEQECRQVYPDVDLDELIDVTVDYSAYYNVKRTLVGGRESFGYTVTREPEQCHYIQPVFRRHA